MLELFLFLFPLLLSALTSGILERRHFEKIAQDELELADILIFNERQPPPAMMLARESLVNGNVVMTVSYFKTFMASIQGLFGGRLNHYETSVEGARREALIRLRRAAKAQNASMVINVRLETSSISKQGKTTGAVEVLAYGTALAPLDSSL